MRAGGMSDSSKWKKQKRSPRPPRHTTKVIPSSELPTPNGATLPSNLSSECLGCFFWWKQMEKILSFSDSGFEMESQSAEGLWFFCREQKGTLQIKSNYDHLTTLHDFRSFPFQRDFYYFRGIYRWVLSLSNKALLLKGMLHSQSLCTFKFPSVPCQVACLSLMCPHPSPLQVQKLPQQWSVPVQTVAWNYLPRPPPRRTSLTWSKLAPQGKAQPQSLEELR